ncbi:PSME3-interacting protein [Drosophila sulfurigaster albostrigata]|uniref:PSME3-interacting protein n=1 Tax=Drosophila sulfurigaster albostrigata TaxID=89887 RepID=UPI002D21C918|nr:PSME3-interacting protein [Drosophila sulfurigaster albostrigata]
MSSGFVTESEAAEARKRRQEEWERVRQPDDPLERPEEPYDGRSLYERLKEQKSKKDMEYEEAHKLKNLIRGLDDDEVQFLELVDAHKMNAERQQMRDEELELKDFRNRVEKLQEESVDKKLQAEIKTTAKSIGVASTTRNTQKSLLGQGIKRRNGEIPTTSKVAKLEQTAVSSTETTTDTQHDVGGLRCIAILPGIGSYTESSDSEASTDTDDLDQDKNSLVDLCGRKIIKKKQCATE